MILFLVAVSFVTVLCILLVHSFLKLLAKRAQLGKLPGNPGIILFGNIGWVMKLYSAKSKYHPGVYVLQRLLGSNLLYYKEGIYHFWMGTSPMVSFFSPDSIELILTSNVSLEKSFEYSFLHKWLGLGLLTSKGSKWRSRRKILTPSLHFRILEDFLPTFDKQSRVLVNKLHSLVDKEYVDISPLIVLLTLDVVCETVMGYHIGAQMGENSDYVTAVHNLADFFNRRSFTPWLWWDFLFNLSSIGRGFEKDLNILHSFTKKVIKEKKQSLLKQGDVVESDVNEDGFQTKKKKSLMDLLLELQLKGEKLSEEDIQEEVDTFMFAGHDTTAMGIIFALYAIGLYPEIQKKLQEEIESIFDDDVDRATTMEDVRNMKYLECTLKECHRLFPSVPMIGRKLNEDIHYNGMVIPKDTNIHCNIISLHRNPDFFPNPEVFDPDRFTPENSLRRHPYSYIPFSAGPRNCIGQKFALLEEKVAVCNILRHFQIISLDPRDKVQMKIEFTLRPAQPMRLKFIPR